jgi:hypothetical protein
MKGKRKNYNCRGCEIKDNPIEKIIKDDNGEIWVYFKKGVGLNIRKKEYYVFEIGGC